MHHSVCSLRRSHNTQSCISALASRTRPKRRRRCAVFQSFRIRSCLTHLSGRFTSSTSVRWALSRRLHCNSNTVYSILTWVISTVLEYILVQEETYELDSAFGWSWMIWSVSLPVCQKVRGRARANFNSFNFFEHPAATQLNLNRSHTKLRFKTQNNMWALNRVYSWLAYKNASRKKLNHGRLFSRNARNNRYLTPRGLQARRETRMDQCWRVVGRSAMVRALLFL